MSRVYVYSGFVPCIGLFRLSPVYRLFRLSPVYMFIPAQSRVYVIPAQSRVHVYSGAVPCICLFRRSPVYRYSGSVPCMYMYSGSVPCISHSGSVPCSLMRQTIPKSVPKACVALFLLNYFEYIYNWQEIHFTSFHPRVVILFNAFLFRPVPYASTARAINMS